MSSTITEYRADFYSATDTLKFSVDSDPTKDPDRDPAPYLIHGALIMDDGVQTMRWVRPQLESYIGSLVDPGAETDVLCVYAITPTGNTLNTGDTAGIKRVEAFALSDHSAVKVGCYMEVTVRDHDQLVIPATSNYKLERLCYDLTTHVVLFDSIGKRKGRRVLSTP